MGKGLSITAFVFAFVLPLVGLILGIIAVVKAKNDPEALKGLAIAAIVIGGIATIVVPIVIFGVFWYSIGSPSEYLSDYQSSCQIAYPLSCDRVMATATGISVPVTNDVGKPIEVSSFSIEGCGENNQKVSLAAGETEELFVNCENPLPFNEQQTSEIVVKFKREGSAIEEITLGMIRYSVVA